MVLRTAGLAHVGDCLSAMHRIRSTQVTVGFVQLNARDRALGQLWSTGTHSTL